MSLMGSRNLLLSSEDPWGHRGGESARIWAILFSLIFHAGLLYLAGDWIGQRTLDTPEGPFIVSLVSIVPDPAPTEREVPRSRELEIAETEHPPDAHIEKVLSEPVEGLPDAPLLEPMDEGPTPPTLIEVARGESTAADSGVLPPKRRDVAGEAAERLIEQLETLPRWPQIVVSMPSEVEVADYPEARPGAEFGIEGPLGERGLIYFEKPHYPTWAKEKGIEAALRFAFSVSPEGNVIRIQTLQKSACSELESLARQAVSRWRFEPLPLGQERIERGEVPIIWDLRRSGSKGE